MGDPFQRDSQTVLADAMEENITLEHARDAYGVVIGPQIWQVAPEATPQLWQGTGYSTSRSKR